MGRLKTLTRRALIALGVLIAGLLLWGVLVEPRLIDVEEEVAPLPGLPAAWDGRRVAVIADLQIGMWLANTGTIRRIVGRLIRERPDAVLIAGDFLYQAGPDPTPEIRRVVDLVRPLGASGIPTLAVLGNHDYSLDEPDDRRDPRMAEQLTRALGAAGIRVLRNEAAAVRLAGAQNGGADPLYIAGVGPNWAGEDDAAAAIGEVRGGAPYLVVMHNPASFGSIPAGRAPVAVAAHTHGGQVRLPFTPDWSWLKLVKGDSVHADGWITDGYGAPGNRLYVNRGIGFSDVPIRINCPPEVTIFTLRRAQSGPVARGRQAALWRQNSAMNAPSSRY